jgi:hypothetical protein
LERGEYDVLPTPVHVRGFLRNYARFLGLDPEPLVDRYERVLDQQTAVTPQANGHEEPATGIYLPPQKENPFFNPVNFQVQDGRSRSSESIVRLVIIIALVAALALIANRFVPLLLGNGDGSEVLTESITETIQNLTNQQGTTADSNASSSDSEGNAANSDTLIIPTDRNNTQDSAAPLPLPTRPTLPALDIIQLKLEITERTWMEITIDGDIVFSGIARNGDPPYEWEALEEAKVNTGNAIAVYVTINDTPWGRMGERGENKEEIWRTTN